jgi:cellulose synthase/poly-beta-1,6-N-acetylglucosamine synthase-like glycosyltransferase
MLETIFITIPILITLGYALLIIAFIIGWDHIPFHEGKNNPENKLVVSCIIPFRNEENHLRALIEGLKKQQYPPSLFEVLLIDDHSTDQSYNSTCELIQDLSNFHLFKNNGEGKKQAIFTGIEKTTNNYIITTDADCVHPSSWIKSITDYLNNNQPDLLIGPVYIQRGKPFLSKFQSIDFMSLVMSGAGAAGIRQPIMCNGANLIIRKDIYLEAQHAIENEYASGDDIFLLQYCKKHKKEIHFLKSKEAIVSTYPQSSITQFLNQRIRWAGKSKGYTDKFTLLVAWLVFLFNTCLLTLPFYMYFIPKQSFELISVVVTAFTLNYILIKKGAKFFQTHFTIFNYFMIQLIYPISIFITVVFTAFGKVSWKGRKYN